MHTQAHIFDFEISKKRLFWAFLGAQKVSREKRYDAELWAVFFHLIFTTSIIQNFTTSFSDQVVAWWSIGKIVKSL